MGRCVAGRSLGSSTGIALLRAGRWRRLVRQRPVVRRCRQPRVARCFASYTHFDFLLPAGIQPRPAPLAGLAQLRLVHGCRPAHQPTRRCTQHGHFPLLRRTGRPRSQDSEKWPNAQRYCPVAPHPAVPAGHQPLFLRRLRSGRKSPLLAFNRLLSPARRRPGKAPDIHKCRHPR